MALATLALSIGAGILQNAIENDVPQTDTLQQNQDESNGQMNNQNNDSIQQNNELNTYKSIDNEDVKSDISRYYNPQNNSQSNKNSSENRLVPKEQEGKWGYVNQSGEIVIAFQYDYANEFGEGLASVRKGFNWGFIDKNGNTVIPFTYSGAFTFINGLAPVFKDGLWGFIDKNENVIIPFQYKEISLSNSTYYDENANLIEY